MNFIFDSKPFCINCDWLQYSVKLKSPEPDIICPEGYHIEAAQGNNIFKDRALVFDLEGNKLLTLLWNPYSKVISNLIMTVQVSNKLLYQDGILSSFNLLRQIVECSFNSVGRVDICCDFEIDNKGLQFLKHLNSGHYYVERKHEGSTWWHDENINGFKKKKLHCITYGSSSSEIKVKIYNKSREQGLVGSPQFNANGEEIEPEPEKPWIVQNWEEMNMDKKQVWRIEFSLSGAGELEWNREKIQLEHIANWSWLIRVFFDLYHNRFVTRINEGRRKGHKNNDKRVWLVNLPIDGEHLTWKEPLEQDKISKPAVKLLRSMMRNLDNETLNCSRLIFESYAKSIINLVENARLGDYFRYVFEDDVLSFFEKKYEEIGQGVVSKSLPPSRFMD